MRYYICKFLAALNFYRGTKPYALAVAFGVLLGSIPNENNVLIWALLAVACVIPMNHLLMLAVQLPLSWLKTLLYAEQLRLGTWLLENPLLYNFFRFWDNLPLLPWLHLTHADTLGALCLGIAMAVGIYCTFILLWHIALFCAVTQHGRQLWLFTQKAVLAAIARKPEGHLPQVLRWLHSKNIQKWRKAYTHGKAALQRAETFKK